MSMQRVTLRVSEAQGWGEGYGGQEMREIWRKNGGKMMLIDSNPITSCPDASCPITSFHIQSSQIQSSLQGFILMLIRSFLSKSSLPGVCPFVSSQVTSSPIIFQGECHDIYF